MEYVQGSVGRPGQSSRHLHHCRGQPHRSVPVGVRDEDPDPVGSVDIWPSGSGTFSESGSVEKNVGCSSLVGVVLLLDYDI